MTLLYPSITPPNGGVQAGHLGSFFIVPVGQFWGKNYQKYHYFQKFGF